MNFLLLSLVSLVALVKASLTGEALTKKIQKVNSDHELFSSSTVNGKELAVFRKIVDDHDDNQTTGANSSYDRWISAMETDADTFRAFLLMEAIDKKKFKFAGRIIGEIKRESRDIILRLQGGLKEEYESVFLRLERKVIDDTIAADQRADVLSLREKLAQKLLSLSYMGFGLTINKVDKAFENGYFLNSYAGIVNNFVHTDDKANYYYNVRELKKAVYWNWGDLVVILVKNYLKKSNLNETEAIEKLAEAGLYREARYASIIKILQKLKIPIMNGDYNVRHIYNSVSDQERRAKMMDLMKLSLVYDKKKFKTMNEGDDTLTVREAIMTGDWKKVAVQFVKDDIGAYDSEWIELAIKFCGIDCVNALLIERVPLPSDALLKTAYTWVEKTKAEEYKKKLAEYRKFYDDKGVCIEGPLGCDKVKYDAHVKKLKEGNSGSTGGRSSGTGTSASGTGTSTSGTAANSSGSSTSGTTGTPATPTTNTTTNSTPINPIATFKSECKPLDA